MHQHLAQPIPQGQLPAVAITDADVCWLWECPECGYNDSIDDPVAEGDRLTCDGCGKQFRVA